MEQSMITTTDNPYSPFTQFDEWYAFDINQGYNTCAYLARVAKTSDELSEADEDIAIESAIDEIVKLNVLGIYKKIRKDDVITIINNEENNKDNNPVNNN